MRSTEHAASSALQTVRMKDQRYGSRIVAIVLLGSKARRHVVGSLDTASTFIMVCPGEGVLSVSGASTKPLTATD